MMWQLEYLFFSYCLWCVVCRGLLTKDFIIKWKVSKYWMLPVLLICIANQRTVHWNMNGNSICVVINRLCRNIRNHLILTISDYMWLHNESAENYIHYYNQDLIYVLNMIIKPRYVMWKYRVSFAEWDLGRSLSKCHYLRGCDWGYVHFLTRLCSTGLFLPVGGMLRWHLSSDVLLMMLWWN